ncbi:16S rRNA (cytosine(1402)-N(4))-methyltransferase, partial [Myxococcota bacterium]|nr:16S rRNA (cytosine(1402)-N(4))-methyltransferase [Myxococcota bacterium]
LAIISFHSLEDRMVKRRFRQLSHPELAIPEGLMLTKDQMPKAEFSDSGAISPAPEELARNPRSRSAILRVLKKLPPVPQHLEDAIDED